jgi:hypothetical protein
MQHIQAGARSFSLLVSLGFDRIVYFGVLGAALMTAAFLASL